MKPSVPSIRNCIIIKKIYKEKLYYNRNRLQNTFCKMINDILNEDKLNKNNDSNFNNDSKNKTK